MKLIKSERSHLGSGQYQIETWQDDEGNEYAAHPGGKRVLIRTAAQIDRIEKAKKVAHEAGTAARAGDWEEHDRLMSELDKIKKES